MGNSNFFVKRKKDAYVPLQPAHFYKTEVWVEEGFEVTFGELLSIWTLPTTSPRWFEKQRE